MSSLSRVHQTFEGTGREVFELLTECPDMPAQGHIGTTIGRFERQERLRRMIEQDIIPRLMLANRASIGRPAETSRIANKPTIDDVSALTAEILSGTARDTCVRIDQLREGGLSPQDVLLQLLAPVARHLGDLWDSDDCSFADVAIGLGHLQQVLRHYGPLFEPQHEAVGKSILLATAAEETHSFGLMMIDLLFRQAGWDVDFEPGCTLNAAAKKVKNTHYDVVGVSIGTDTLLDRVACDITVLRRVSRNASLSILVGGPALSGHPERLALLGADAMAEDGNEAVVRAEQAIKARARL